MRHKTTEAVFHYFNELRADRTAPLRNEIDPSALKSVLPDLFILEKKRDGSVRFRLAGTRVCLIMGHELRERAFTEIWEETVRHRMRLAADTVLANRTALELAVTAIDEEGDTMALEMLLLPLFSNAEHCDRIFGSLVTLESSIPAEDRWRFLTPADLFFMHVDADGAPRPAASAASLASRSVASSNLGSPAARITHLRVLEGGRRD
ncbi:MAG: PAS domain-containing protein [Rhizobium sp.]|nr:PAS domain-containing protein [Rhizobium sp.]